MHGDWDIVYLGGTDEDGERVSGKFGVLCDSAMTKDMLIVKFSCRRFRQPFLSFDRLVHLSLNVRQQPLCKLSIHHLPLCIKCGFNSKE